MFRIKRFGTAIPGLSMLYCTQYTSKDAKELSRMKWVRRLMSIGEVHLKELRVRAIRDDSTNIKAWTDEEFPGYKKMFKYDIPESSAANRQSPEDQLNEELSRWSPNSLSIKSDVVAYYNNIFSTANVSWTQLFSFACDTEQEYYDFIRLFHVVGAPSDLHKFYSDNIVDSYNKWNIMRSLHPASPDVCYSAAQGTLFANPYEYGVIDGVMNG